MQIFFWVQFDLDGAADASNRGGLLLGPYRVTVKLLNDDGALFSSQINFKGEASKFLLDFPIRQEAGFQTELSSPLPDQRQQQLPVPSINHPARLKTDPNLPPWKFFGEKSENWIFLDLKEKVSEDFFSKFAAIFCSKKLLFITRAAVLCRSKLKQRSPLNAK